MSQNSAVHCANDTETYCNQLIRKLLSGTTDSKLLDLIITEKTNMITQSVQQLIKNDGDYIIPPPPEFRKELISVSQTEEHQPVTQTKKTKIDEKRSQRNKR